MFQTAVVCALLVMNAWSIPIKTQPESSLSERAGRHRRSDNTVEFKMDTSSHQQLQKNSTLEYIAESSQQDFNGEFVCPDYITKVGPVHVRSSCPWYYMVTHVPTRFPVTILHATTPCDYAIGSNRTLECTPITQSVTVLIQDNQKDSQGFFVWKQEVIQVTIGYTAAGRDLDRHETTTTATTQAPSQEPIWVK